MQLRALIVTLGLGGWIPLSGCVDVNGGAVELSWDIRQASGGGGDCSCASAGIQTVQLLCADVADSAISCADANTFPPWPCEDGHGATRFEIPEGDWQLSIRIACDGDSETCDPRVPDPIVRTVERGKVVELNALLILVDQCG